MGCHLLLQGIFLTQGLNLSFLHCRQILYHWVIWEALTQPTLILEAQIQHWVIVYGLPFSQGELLSGVLDALSCLPPLITAKAFLNTEF